MHRNTIIIAAIAVGALALPAVAASTIDTLLTEGYDTETTRLVFGVSPIDQDGATQPSLDCTAETGEYEYEVDDDGVVVALRDAEGDVEFGSEDAEDVTDAVVYGSENAAECELQAVDVTGPNGQVNHGQVVSSFVHALRAMGLKGNGCMIRLIAQSDYGKGDQQITVSEAAEDTTANEGAETVDRVDLESIATACGKHGPANSENSPNRGEAANEDHGKPENAGKPESAGKPENAGKPEGAGRSEDHGRPDHAGKPDDAENAEGDGTGNGRPSEPGSNGRGNGKP